MSDGNKLKLKKIGINTYKEAVIYMRHDCEICRAEGFGVHARILVQLGDKQIIATLNMIEDGWLEEGEASLSNFAWHALGARDGDMITLSHPMAIHSFSYVRSKIFGHSFSENEIGEIIQDISNGQYSEIHIATFLTACAAIQLSQDEIAYLTRSMVGAGEQLAWDSPLVVDKHCVGGLPGNRTTPIVVSIVTEFGLLMPKTSSRAITSPAGTADVVEVFTRVDLNIAEMRKVVEKENGCMIWGGAVTLSPVDDILISVERPMNLDSEGQLIASVLSKKISAGSSHVFIDIPVGPTAKVRATPAADRLARLFRNIGESVGLMLHVELSDGAQPVGRGVGPCLEALDVLKVLQNKPDAPQDLKERATYMAGQLIEFSPSVGVGQGYAIAREILESGRAWKKFQRICEAQGGLHEPVLAQHTFEVVAAKRGMVISIDNRNLARIAKLAGAPHDKGSGVKMHVKLNDRIEKNHPLFTIYAESKGELEYAKVSLEKMGEIVQVAEIGS